MIQFFIINGNKRTCTATDSHKAAEILRLMFHASKGYVVENNKIFFAQNMTIEEAEISHGIKKQSMEVLPVAPKAAKVKPKKVKKKPAKSKAKKTTLKSKVVIKNNKKPAPKKAVVKSKVKPKTKPVKAKTKPVKAKAKAKGGKNR